MRLQQLPTDVLLALADNLRIREAISLVKTCKDLYELSAHRAFWIAVLNLERCYNLLACSVRDDLQGHDVVRLKNIVTATLQRSTNWSRVEPKLLSYSTNTIPWEGVEILGVINGTAIMLVFHNEKVSCWDCSKGVFFDAPGVPVRFKTLALSRSATETRDTYTTCLLSGEGREVGYEKTSHIIRVHHSQGIVTKLEQLDSRVIELPYEDCRTCITTKQAYICAFPCTATPKTPVIVVELDLDTWAVKRSTVESFHYENLEQPETTVVVGFACSPTGDGIYLAKEDHYTYSLYNISTRTQGPDYNWERAKTELNTNSFAGLYPVGNPQYGVCAISVRETNWAFNSMDHPYSTTIRFWSTDALEPLSGGTKVLREPSIILPGVPHTGGYDQFLVFNGVSGLSMVILLGCTHDDGWEDEVAALYLVQCDPGTGVVRASKLELPPEFDLATLAGGRLDEALGVFHVDDGQGEIVSLRYG